MKKKARLGDDNNDATKQEIEVLRQYIVACPNVTKNGKAVQAALEGLDRELKRMERDTKLKQKFQQTTTTTTTTAAASATARANNDSLYSSTLASEKDEFTEVNSSDFEANNNTAVPQNKKKKPRDDDNDDNDDEQLLMEWQNVHGDDDPIGSVLGTSLAQTAIQSIADRAVAVSSPLAALALALHAALVSDTLSFACTGVPEPTTTNNNNNSNKGFAPPIRELPKEKFLPNQWESPQHIRLRYRKPGVGTVVLSVALNDCNGSSNDPAFVTMEWIHKNEPSKSLRFALLDHINLDSITAALQKDVRVAPTLHYKALPILFTNFCNAFDLGTVREGAATTNADVAMQMLGQGGEGRANPAPAVASPMRPVMVAEDRDPLRAPRFGRVVNEHEEPSLQVFQPRGGRGDFAGDLGPLGIMPGNLMGGPPGNLLGPNHPMFGGNLGMGGRGMKPRFDPFGPPGGPTDPAFGGGNGNLHPNDVLRRRQGPGGSGNPNPDLLRPPNSFDNNMYM